ncbi:MAG: Smr/MutS family protein [Pseudomonadota bacterium]
MSRRTLSPEERRLWQRVAKEVEKPLDEKDRQKLHLQQEMLQEQGATQGSTLDVHGQATNALPAQTVPRLPGTARGGSNDRKTKPASVSRQRLKSLPPALNAGDPRRDRHAGTVRLPIDRTLDLHGRTEREAEVQFRRFIMGASADGCQCVLVITGKGGPASASNLARARQSGFDHGRRGVLRTRFMDWLESSDVRPLVARAAKARQPHGGDGAFYVFLKTRKAKL